MKKVLFLILLGVFGVMSNAQTVTVIKYLGNLTVGTPYHGCVSTLCYSERDSIYKYTIIGNGNRDTWGFDLADTPEMSRAILQGIVDSYQGADTIWINGYLIECEKDKGFYVSEAAPGTTLPDDCDYWFSIANIKKDIKFLRRIEKGKLTRREKRAFHME